MKPGFGKVMVFLVGLKFVDGQIVPENFEDVVEKKLFKKTFLGKDSNK